MAINNHTIEVGGKKYDIIVNNDDPHSIHSTLSGGGTLATIYITLSPTNNCQLSSIGRFVDLLRQPYVTLEQKREILAKAWNLCSGINQVLIDIKDGYANETIEFFGKENMVIHTPYNSTNGSRMNLFIFKMKDFINKYAQPFK